MLKHLPRPASSEPAALKILMVRLNLLMVAAAFARSHSRRLKKCPLCPRTGFSTIPHRLFGDGPVGAASGRRDRVNCRSGKIEAARNGL